jgi:hypothetical protein
MTDHDGFAESLEAKSDQINAADLMGTTVTIKIAGLKVQSKEQQKWTFRLDGNEKFFRPSKGMCRLIAKIWGDPKTYAGQSMTLYREDDALYAGQAVGGIRISHMTGISAPVEVSIPISRTKSRAYTVRPLTVESPAAPVRDAAVEAAALAAAAQGVASFTAWWRSDYGVANRAAVGPVLGECKRIAKEFDAAQVPDSGEGPPM